MGRYQSDINLPPRWADLPLARGIGMIGGAL
jgi:hypothetical protein